VSYVVRNPSCEGEHFYSDYSMGCFAAFENATRLDLDRALYLCKLQTDREVVHVTWALRWYKDGKPKQTALHEDGKGPYYKALGDGPQTGAKSVKRRDATRFETHEEARAFLAGINSALRIGAFGPDDTQGYRVVRLMRVVKS